MRPGESCSSLLLLLLLANCLFSMLHHCTRDHRPSMPSGRDACGARLPGLPALTRWIRESAEPNRGLEIVRRILPASVCCFRTCRHCPKWVRGMGDLIDARVRASDASGNPRGIDFNVQVCRSRGPTRKINGWRGRAQAPSRLLETDAWLKDYCNGEAPPGGSRRIAISRLRIYQLLLSIFLDVFCDWSYPQT